jgi:hypothetical protein
MKHRTAFLFFLCAAAWAGDLESGFTLMYNLRFGEARALFAKWQKENPADPLGPAAEAASYMFEEFERHGVLTSEFFLDDDLLLGGVKDKPDEATLRAFHAASARAGQIARRALAGNAKDARALFALVMVTGMEADAASLFEKKHFRSLKLVREAESLGRRLLDAAPGMEDAYVALGAANYIISCLPAYKRALLWVGGVRWDRRKGMQQLAAAARNGNYLRPYAKMMLALAHLREKQPDMARALVRELVAEFPANPIFLKEYQKLER